VAVKTSSLVVERCSVAMEKMHEASSRVMEPPVLRLGRPSQ
jgi:hypothetical protein